MSFLEIVRCTRHNTSLSDASSPVTYQGEKSEKSEKRVHLPGVPDVTEIAWRVAAFRAVLPDHGTIWPPKIRDTQWTDAPGCCSLCGDALPTDPTPRFARCEPCMQALWIALHETREGEHEKKVS